MAKNILRKQLTGKITDQYYDNKIIDNAVCLIEKYNPRIVGIFLAQEEEIDLTSVMIRYPEIGFTLPKIAAQKEEIFFTNYYLGAALEPNDKYTNYLEPISDKIVAPDLIFVPGIAFDLKGYRLGRGKGHYDKYLAGHKATKIGVCRGTNLLTSIYPESHDIKMDHIITEDMILNLS
jgi:5-formyltetrahydrofolate cyclo-ligase